MSLTVNLHRIVAGVIAKKGAEETFTASNVAETERVQGLGVRTAAIARVLDDFSHTGMLWQFGGTYQKRRDPVIAAPFEVKA